MNKKIPPYCCDEHRSPVVISHYWGIKETSTYFFSLNFICTEHRHLDFFHEVCWIPSHFLFLCCMLVNLKDVPWTANIIFPFRMLITFDILKWKYSWKEITLKPLIFCILFLRSTSLPSINFLQSSLSGILNALKI